MFADPAIVAIVKATRERAERAASRVPVDCFNRWCAHPWCLPPRTNVDERRGDRETWGAYVVRALEGNVRP